MPDSIKPADLHKYDDAIYIDVREKEEWDEGHIDGALLMPLSELMAGKRPDIAKEAEIVLYCQKGYRSLQAAEIFKMYGYTNLINMHGGYAAWVEATKNT